MTDDLLKYLPPTLEHLNLISCWRISNESLSKLPEGLRYLSLSKCFQITEVGLRYLSGKEMILSILPKEKLTKDKEYIIPESVWNELPELVEDDDSDYEQQQLDAGPIDETRERTETLNDGLQTSVQQQEEAEDGQEEPTGLIYELSRPAVPPFPRLRFLSLQGCNILSLELLPDTIEELDISGLAIENSQLVHLPAGLKKLTMT